MKTVYLSRFLSIVLLASLPMVMLSCSDDETSATPPTIDSFSPESGIYRTTVIITGTNFSLVASENVVTFNGVPATVSAGTSTMLTADVPAEATTGKITVTVDGQTATSATDFTVPAPTIVSYSPVIAAAGVSITITGTNFSSIEPDNTVKFNGIEGTVTSSSSTQLTVIVPSGATSGAITVKVGANTATSSGNFEICSGSAELLISDIFVSNTAGATSYVVSFKVTNVGAVNADLSKMHMQNYASTDNAVGNDVAASGFGLSAGPTIAPGQFYTTPDFSCNIVGGGTTSSHRFLIITLYDYPEGSIPECNTDNNVVITPFD